MQLPAYFETLLISAKNLYRSNGGDMDGAAKALINILTTPHAQRLLTKADRRAITQTCVRQAQDNHCSDPEETIDASVERGWAMMAILKVMVVDDHFLQHDIDDVYQTTACLARAAESWRSELERHREQFREWPPRRARGGTSRGAMGGSLKMVAARP